jgi:hypothetical protein
MRLVPDSQPAIELTAPEIQCGIQAVDLRQGCYNKATNALFSTRRRFRLERAAAMPQVFAPTPLEVAPASFHDFLGAIVLSGSAEPEITC